MPLRGPKGGPPSTRGNLVNTKLTLPPSERPGSPRKVLLRNQKKDTHSSAKAEDRIHGVGLATKTSLCRQLPDLPTPVSERFMKLHFPLNPSPSHSTLPDLSQSSAHTPPFLPEVKRQKTLSTRNSTPSWRMSSQATNSSCWDTSMREWIPTATTGKVY